MKGLRARGHGGRGFNKVGGIYWHRSDSGFVFDGKKFVPSGDAEKWVFAGSNFNPDFPFGRVIFRSAGIV